MSNDQPSTSGSIPSSPPGLDRPANQQDWILQQLNRVDREVGMLTSSVKSQEKQIEDSAASARETTRSLNRINLTLAFSAGMVLVIGTIGGYLIDKRFDQIFSLLSQ